MNKSFFHRTDNFASGLKILGQIIKLGTLIVLAISIIYITHKLSANDIKSALTYYYAEALVLDGKIDEPVNYTSESGNNIILPAITIVGNPLIMLSKQQFNWIVIKGIFIGYISFKIFCLGFLLWLYVRKKMKTEPIK